MGTMLELQSRASNSSSEGEGDGHMLRALQSHVLSVELGMSFKAFLQKEEP